MIQLTRKSVFGMIRLALFLAVVIVGSTAAYGSTLKLNKTKAELYAGAEGFDTLRLKIKKSSRVEGETVTFSSSRPKTVSVSETGEVTALKKGSAVITVISGERKAVCKITVKKPKLTLTSAKKVSLKVGGKSGIRVKTVPAGAGVTYESANPAVVTVTKSGRLKGVSKGETVVTVSGCGGRKKVHVTVGGKDAGKPSVETVRWNSSWRFAGNSKIHSSTVKLYRAVDSKGIVVAVNAGHGTSGGSSVKTLCHPDGSLKVTGGSTAAGSKYADAVSTGTVFLDGTSEAAANLSLAKLLKTKLLEAGYDVLMIREGNDVQLDNIARTLFANNHADCHISLHYDSTTNNKGAYCIGVPDIASYKAMQPVASNWRGCNRLGECLIAGMRSSGVKIYGSGNGPADLTQTSYSTIPSIDVEVGDRGSSHAAAVQSTIAKGIVNGVKKFFGK